jgi:DNA-binding XRE family transcriptional regulator
MARTRFSELRDTVVAKPGAVERLAGLRAETLEEIRLYELRHGEAISQAELAGRLDVTQGAISKLEHSDDGSVSRLDPPLPRPNDAAGSVVQQPHRAWSTISLVASLAGVSPAVETPSR